MDLNASLKENLEAAKHNLEAARQDAMAAGKCENIDDPLDIHVTEVLSMYLAKAFIRLHIIPNVVTILSMITGIAGGVLLMWNRLPLDIAGAFLILFSYVLDCSDGQVARATRHFSKVGRLLDGLSDATVYLVFFTALIVRLPRHNPLFESPVWTAVLIVLLIVTYLLYIAQNQLPDYFKNLHMFMIDGSKNSELTRAKHILAQREKEKKGSIARFGLTCYYPYTRAQERRAPKTQKLLDAIEVHGKNSELSYAFFQRSRRLVRWTNLLTFNLRTFVLLICVFLHVELAGFLFVIAVQEPIRWVLLRKYEDLSESMLPLVK